MQDNTKLNTQAVEPDSSDDVMACYAVYYLSRAIGMLVMPPLPKPENVRKSGMRPNVLEELFGKHLKAQPPVKLGKMVQEYFNLMTVEFEAFLESREAGDKDTAAFLFETAYARPELDDLRECIFELLDQETSRLLEAVLMDLRASAMMKPSSYLPQQLLVPSDVIGILVRTAFIARDRWKSVLGGFQASMSSGAGSVSLVIKSKDQPPDTIYADDGSILEVEVREWLAPVRATVDRLNDLHDDVFDILVCKWLEEHGGNMEHWSEVSVPDIISARGLKMKRGQSRDAAIEQYSRTLEDVLLPIIEGHAIHYLRDKRGKTEQVNVNTPLFVVEGRVEAYGLRGRPLLVGIRYKPGMWIRPLIGDCYTPQLAKMLRCALTFDPYHEYKEKRLARYLSTYIFRINRGQPTKMTMTALLDGAHIVRTETARNEPGEYICGVEAAIQNVVGKWGEGGEIACLETDPLPRKGKLDIWLSRKWRIVPPDALAEHYRQASSRWLQYELKARGANILDSRDVRNAHNTLN